MKRTGHIYEKIYDKDNIRLAIYKASDKKRSHSHVKRILMREEYYVSKVHEMLKDETFAPSEPTIKTIQDASSGKVRTIYKPNFYPDQIVHWALMLQIEPILMKGMYAWSCGSIPNRGPTYAQKAIRKWLDNDRQHTKYCLKLDIKKFYPSIDNETLKQKFRKKIKDKRCLELIDCIIDGNQGQPIGYYTSQWFANFFLEELDHYIKQEMKVKYYVRYVDDLVLFGNNKKKLHRVRKEVAKQLENIHLEVKGDYQVFRVDKRAVDFLGFRFYRNRTTLRRRNSLRIKRRMKKIHRKGYLNVYDAQAVISYWGWIKQTDSFGFYHKHVKPYVTIGKAKKVVSEHAKRENNKNRTIGNC